MRPQTLLSLTALFSRFERPLRAAFRAVIEPRKPRHRVLRVVLALVGLLLLALLLIVGLVAGTAMVVGGLAWRGVRQVRNPAPRGGVLDARYRVVGRPMLGR